jgi:hypothetical protein
VIPDLNRTATRRGRARTASPRHPDDLVVQTATDLEVLDLDTGSIVRRLALPTAGAILSGLQAGVALLVAGTQLHLLRLGNGKDAVINAPGTGPVHAQLTPAGLFYSYTVADRRYPGRVAFVPSPRLPLR